MRDRRISDRLRTTYPCGNREENTDQRNRNAHRTLSRLLRVRPSSTVRFFSPEMYSVPWPAAKGACLGIQAARPKGMPHYEKYTTTVIGAHSVPRWYEAMDRLVASGQLAPGDFADAQLRATQAAILEQEVAGIDVITGGEMHRRTHNRHSPPNAMLNHFWQKIPSFQGETKPKPITSHDPNVFHPAAICRGPIIDSIDLGLVDEFRTVSVVRPQAGQGDNDGTASFGGSGV